MKKKFIYLIFIVLFAYNACNLNINKENKLPTSPILKYPSNKDVNIKLDTLLHWLLSTDEDGNALKYDVFFDTENPPLKKIVNFLSNSSYLPVLQPNTTYYWRVVVNDGKGGTVKSDVWSFTTIPDANTLKNHNPSAPVLISPLDNAINKPLKILLEWGASTDEDGENVKYEVMFGTDLPPNVTLTTIQTTSTLSPVLRYDTKYYWQIITTDGKGGKNQSEIRSFTTTININLNSQNPPKVPILLSPFNNSINIPLNQVINWNTSSNSDGDKIKYYVLFSTDNPPTSIISTLQPDTFYLPQLNSNTIYYWKIVAIDTNDITSESEIRTFTTLNDALTTITLFSPPNNETKIKLDELLKWNEWKPTGGGSAKYTVFFATEGNPLVNVSMDQTVTTFTPTLNRNTVYFWKVIANDGAGNTSESEIWKFTTLSNPPPKPILTSPSNNAKNISLTKIIEWGTVIDGNNIIKYNVLFDTVYPPTKTVSVLQTSNTFKPSLIGNKTYFWQIIVDNGKDGQTKSDIWNFTTFNSLPSKPNLIIPQNLATNKNIDDSLKWNKSTDPDGDKVNYNVFLETINPPTTIVASSILDTFFIPSLFGNTTYYWKITASDGIGRENESVVSSFKTKLILPPIPTLISPDNNSIDIIINSKLTWNGITTSSGKVANYDVFLGTSNPPTTKVSTLQTQTSYTFSSLLPNTTYYWKINADDGNGGVSTSEIRNFKTIVPPEVPILISPNNIATKISLNTNLSWNVSRSTSSVVKYNVFLDTFKIPVTKLSDMQSGTSYSATSLLSNTNYYWKIVAVDGNGLSSESEIRTFKTSLVPPSAIVLTSPAISDNNANLNAELLWVASTGYSGKVVKYNVYLDILIQPVKKLSSLQTGTSFITSLLSNTIYYWKIEADDGNEGITVSEIRSFKTKIVPPSVPILTYPLLNGVLDTLAVELKWNASTGSSGNVIKYDVYFDTLSNLVSKVSSLQVGTTLKRSNLKVNKTYYWKIVADDGNGGISESEIRSFGTVTFDFVKVESGTFTMGCTSEQGISCNADELPSFSVTLSSFSIGKYEVTTDQWINVMGSNPSVNKDCKKCAVNQISWNEIQNFINKLNTNTGKNYRLPTEAEWEYAARGGKISKAYKYSGSNNSQNVAWYNANSGGTPKEVGTLSPNELGIYDMSGNVAEWCSDWYGAYTNTAKTNPKGPSTGNTKVIRGGTINSNIDNIRVSVRGLDVPNYNQNFYGFRLVLP